LSLSVPPEYVMPVRPNALRRCLGNLIGTRAANSNHVWLTGVAITDGIDILVDDDGRGIRPSDRIAHFELLSAWIPHGTRRPEASDWASLSPATWRAVTAARSLSRAHLRVACALRVHLPR